ncbi:ATP-binding protein [Actinomycetospora termitidis]|uniref:ATP-binding protein n=1 Tax=Actinomycetospora termitidis TaxID=3053470 RepID=A0ABT7M7C3_9PSEU|nr:ATP-binding protein [Actinomycetospora sp. Odt1-22]MDL5156578.1 ATP-binding protein [Actinomycetospora sp. Odt1-22]
MSPGADHAHVLGRLAVVEARVRRAVAARRTTDPQPDDPFRGLYVSDHRVEQLLDETERPVPWPDPVDEALLRRVEQDADAARGPVRLRLLAERFGLVPLDVELLLLATAPDLDSRFEPLYGYLNDDVSRRRATIGTALRLCGCAEARLDGRVRFGHDAPLVAGGLVVIDDAERPFLSRALRVPDRVTAHLLGDDRPDPALLDVLVAPPPVGHLPLPGDEALAGALDRGACLVYLREQPGASGSLLGATALERVGRPVLTVDATRLAATADPVATAGVLVREARLAGAGLVVEPVTALADRPALLRLLATAPVSVLLVGPGAWDPGWSFEPPLQFTVTAAGVEVRESTWRSMLGARLGEGVDPARETAQFQLDPPQIARAARAAVLQADLTGTTVDGPLLRRGAREQNAAGLEGLARRIEPAVGWDDLVLPAAVLTALHGLAARARHRDLVLGRWRMRPGGGRGHGLIGLLTGESGTGKTMSAEVLAADLGLDLYTVDLASVVDKYVGETEKNLEKIFVEAARVNGVLLFDEADAIFGKRSDVRDAQDRYANMESAYLLQRMESFDGLALLSTNLRANLDDAFVRRLDVIVDFPTPGEALRRALWDRCLGTRLPRAHDLDLDFCARAFDLAGGSIRAVAVTAAYRAAEAARPVEMGDLVTAVAAEYRKLGRLCLDREFGAYADLAG